MLKNYILFSLIFLATDFIYLRSVSNYFNMQVKAIQGDKIQLKMVSTICATCFNNGYLLFCHSKEYVY